MDVVPPFDSDTGLHGHHADDGQGASPQSVASAGCHRQDEASFIEGSDDLLPPAAGGEDIPAFDLGERILVEQRRATARRRRGPGVPAFASADVEDLALPVVVPPVEAAPDDVAQLQHIVADIVARDIERLCQGLKRTSG